MKIYFLMFMLVFGFAQASDKCAKNKMLNANQTNETKFDRLPDNIEPQTKVRKDVKNDKGEIVSTEIVTVEQRLKDLGAKYKNEKLIDNKGKEIRFFEPFCRGASENFEEDQKARKEKEKELAELEKNYNVIVLYCDPTQIL